MPLFTLHRNYVLRTTHGHTIAFQKGTPVLVPAVCIEDAVAIGAVPVEGIESVDPEVPVEAQLSPADRKAAVFKAFDVMSTRGERMDFTASGVPNAKRIPALTGFEITTTERDVFWLEYKANENADRAQTELDLRMSTG